jgi:hypothetical protein
MERSFDEQVTGISPLVLVLTFAGRASARPLRREFIETKGKSQFFTNNSWRLSPSGIAFYGANIAGIIEAQIKKLEEKAAPEVTP